MAPPHAAAAQSQGNALQALDQLARLGVRDAAIDHELACLDETRFRVAFVGEWNSGKSTLINLLLDRQVLPVGRYPETGTACYVHSDSAARVTASWSDGRTETGGGSVDAIREWVQITRKGTRIDAASLPGSIDIGAPDVDLPEMVDLIDTPGLNDDPEMVDRALAATAGADAIVFVLNTRHFLTVVEADVIRELVARSGDGAILFVLNVFLDQDSTVEWADRLQEDFPIQEAKLRKLLAELDYEPAADLVAVSGRAGTAPFGADDFRHGVTRFWRDMRDQLVAERRRANLRRAVLRAQGIAGERVRPLQAAFDAAQRAHQDYEFKKERREAFLSIAKRSVSGAIERWAANARLVAQRVASDVTASSIKYDDTLSVKLTDALGTIGRQAADELYANLEGICATYQQTAPQKVDRGKIRSEFEPGHVTVLVANNNMGGGGVAGGAATGAAIGTVIPVVGTIFGALIGGVIGAVASGGNAVERDVAETRKNVRDAVNDVIETVEGARSDLVDIAKSLRVRLPDVAKPDPTELDRWRELESMLAVAL